MMGLAALGASLLRKYRERRLYAADERIGGMTMYIHIPTDTYPLTFADIRARHQNVSFPEDGRGVEEGIHELEADEL